MGMQVFNPNDGPFYLSDGSSVDGHGWAEVEEDAKVTRALASGRLVAVAPSVEVVPDDTPGEEPVDEETPSSADTLIEDSQEEPKE